MDTGTEAEPLAGCCPFTSDSPDVWTSLLPLLLFLFLCLCWTSGSSHLPSFHGNECVCSRVCFKAWMERFVSVLLGQSTDSLSLQESPQETVAGKQQFSPWWLVFQEINSILGKLRHRVCLLTAHFYPRCWSRLSGDLLYLSLNRVGISSLGSVPSIALFCGGCLAYKRQGQPGGWWRVALLLIPISEFQVSMFCSERIPGQT